MGFRRTGTRARPLSPRTLILIVGLGIMLNPLNSSMIAVALVTLQQEFSVSLADTTWLISCYYLASAVVQPLAGKLGDLVGRKSLFLLGLGLAGLSSLLAPFSASFAQLILFRTLQAVGSSMVHPSGMGMVRRLGSEDQGKWLGWVSVFSSGSAAFGPTAGALLIAHWNWSAMFLVNLPFIIAALVLGWMFLPEEKKSGQALKGTFSFDILGAFLFSLAVVSLLWSFLFLGESSSFIAAATCLLFFVLLVIRERKTEEPFIDVRLFLHNRALSLLYSIVLLFNAATYTLFFVVPSVFQTLGYSLTSVGLFMLFIPGVNTMIGPLGGMRVDRKGFPYVLNVSAVLLFVSTLWLFLWPPSAAVAGYLAAMAVLGVGMAYAHVGLQSANFELMPQRWAGSASGLFMTTRYMGTIGSSALLGFVFRDHLELAEIRFVFLLTFLLACAILPLCLWLAVQVNRLPGGLEPESE